MNLSNQNGNLSGFDRYHSMIESGIFPSEILADSLRNGLTLPILSFAGNVLDDVLPTRGFKQGNNKNPQRKIRGTQDRQKNEKKKGHPKPPRGNGR
ncbi:hypothetical protein KC675_04240 [Candidatus Dojkabacteria bacterium]|uniref:Uncharacterized protein n=1 Tax=Candidatus Dojkabacteria bacterium TaxID=2099670 RepID=A0A955L1D7_9BACT|nr:hypothetical protein [Candidatus Dojkabacteria bacterium]